MQLLLEQTERMLAEVQGLQALAGEVSWLTKVSWSLTDDKDICVDVDISLNDRVYGARLLYPQLFPHAPAYVRPRDAEEVWSTHQYIKEGTLCLEWGPDNWHSGVTGADLIRSTFKLLAFETMGPAFSAKAPSRHELTVGQRVRSHSQRFLLTAQLRAGLEGLSRDAPVRISIGTLHRRKEMVAFATKLGGDEHTGFLGAPKELADPESYGSWIREGWVVWCDEWRTLPKPAGDQAAIRDFLKEKGCWPWPDEEDQSGFLLLVDSCMSVRPIALAPSGGAYEYFLIDCVDTSQLRQPKRHAALQDKRVAIVGLGSVGSKVAVALARSGVSRFLLIDDDVFLPSNLVRNQLDWSSAGYDKVDAVRNAIELVQPNADVATRMFRFAGQESASFNTAVLEQVATCDLVIDATASAKVFSSLAAICARRQVAMVWGEVFAGGIGAMMARSLPGWDADPLEIRRAIHLFLADKPDAPFKRAMGYDVEEENEVVTGGDAEVGALSASLTQFAIDALTRSAGPRFPAAAYLFGYQKAWFFDAPFDTHPVLCPRAADIGDAKPGPVNVKQLTELVNVLVDSSC